MDEARRLLRVSLQPSKTLALALASAYAGAALCLLALDFEWGIKCLVLGFLTLSGYCDLCMHRGRHRRRVKEIVLDRDEDWRVIDESGSVFCGRPVGARLLHSQAVCFSIELHNGKRVPVYVLEDMCGADAFRQLRVWLNMNGERRQAYAARRRFGWRADASDSFQS